MKNFIYKKRELLFLMLFFIYLFFCLMVSSGRPAIAKTFEQKKLSGERLSFKNIPINYDFFIKIKPEDLQKGLMLKKYYDKFNTIVNQSSSHIKSFFIFFSFGRQAKGNADFIALIRGNFNYTLLLQNLKNIDENFKIGDYDGKVVFRYYNLAGMNIDDDIILSSVSGLKKIIAGKGKDYTSILDNDEYMNYCDDAFKKFNECSPFFGMLGNKFITFFTDSTEKDFIYKNLFKKTLAIIFSINKNTANFSIICSDDGAAKELCDSINEQIASSLKETAETLAEVDVIEVETNNNNLTKMAIREMAYTRKFLSLIIELNKKAALKLKSNSIEISININEDILKSIEDIISNHINSFNILTELFLSSEISCSRYAKTLETASLLYLARYPGKKSSIAIDDLYERDFIQNYMNCPSGGEYKIIIDNTNKIIVECSIHK